MATATIFGQSFQCDLLEGGLGDRHKSSYGVIYFLLILTAFNILDMTKEGSDGAAVKGAEAAVKYKEQVMYSKICFFVPVGKEAHTSHSSI